MFRNIIDVTSVEGIQVDAGSLWKLEADQLVLVDKDQYVTHDLTDVFVAE